VLSLMRFLNSSLSLMTLIVIWMMDPISYISLETMLLHILLPTRPIINIINLSISTGIFPDQFQNCSVNPRTSRSRTQIKLISVIIVLYLTYYSCQNSRVVRLAHYLSTSNLLNYFQFTCIKHHSTETTLLHGRR